MATTTLANNDTIPTAAKASIPGDISQILNSKGPIVNGVLLASDGSIRDVSVDTTPKAQAVAKLLGGPFTFLGQYEEEGLMLMVRREDDSDDESDQQLPTNLHKLQPPFHETSVKGDVLALKVAPEDDDDNEEASATATPIMVSSKPNDEFFLNYTKAEWEKFAARTDVVAPLITPTNSDEAEQLEEEEEESEEEPDMEDDEDDDEDGQGGLMELLMGQVLQRFQAENGRLPQEEELKALEAAVSEKLNGFVG